MKFSWKIGQLNGVAVQGRASGFQIALTVAAATAAARGLRLDGPESLSVAFAAGSAVAVHELGHVLVAGWLGSRAHQIVLSPFGGIMPPGATPLSLRHLAIALAGPVLNLVVAIDLLVWIFSQGVPPGLETEILGHSFAARLAWMNAALAILNLLPAFPLDGGHVLSVLLARRLPPRRAIAITGLIGVNVALAFAVASYVYGLLLLLPAMVIGSASVAAIARRQAISPMTPLGSASRLCPVARDPSRKGGRAPRGSRALPPSRVAWPDGARRRRDLP